MSLNNQKCMPQPTFISLQHLEYSQELRYYPFTVNLDRCIRSFNTLDELCSRVNVPNQTEDLHVHVFNMIIRIHEPRPLPKYISCKCICKFDSKRCNWDQKWKNNKCQCECKNPKEHCACGIFGILQHVVAKIVNM